VVFGTYIAPISEKGKQGHASLKNWSVQKANHWVVHQQQEKKVSESCACRPKEKQRFM
jgi:hypothetical protein